MTLTKFAMLAALMTALSLPVLPVAETKPIASGVTQQEEDLTFDLGPDGMKFEHFMTLIQKHLGRPLSYDSRRLNGNNKTIHIVGKVTVPAANIETFIHETCIAHGLMLLPVSSRPDSLMVVDDMQTSQYLKSRAIPVDVAEIKNCAKRPASIFTTVIPLEFVEADHVQRALNNIIQEHRMSFSHPLPTINAVVVCADGRLLNTFHEMIIKMEAAAQSEQSKNYNLHKKLQALEEKPQDK